MNLSQNTADKPTADKSVVGLLAEISRSDRGTLVSLILRKRGVVRGTKEKQVIYGDDFVHVLLWAGFPYKSLAARSLKRLRSLWLRGGLTKTVLLETLAAGHPNVTVNDVVEAIQELEDAFLKVVRGDSDYGNMPNRDDAVWKPLRHNGSVIQGAKIYVGRPDTSNRHAPEPGTVYIDGIKFGEKILEPAPNGPWKARQKPKTAAKNILRAKLPVGLYARYNLDPKNLLVMKIGPEAAAHAKAEGLIINPEIIRSLFKIPP